MTDRKLHLPSVSFPDGQNIWPRARDDYRRFEAGFKRLSRRALLMAGLEDIVILDRSCDPEYMELLNSCKAGGAKILHPAVLDGACLAEDVLESPELVDFIKTWQGGFEIYMPAPAIEKLASVTNSKLVPTSSAVVETLNDKLFFSRLLEDIGAKQVPGFVGNANSVIARLSHSDGERVIVRGSRSVGGSLAWIARSEAERRAVIDKIKKPGGCKMFLIQSLLNVQHSPNLQFYLTDDRIYLFGETLQKLTDGVRHVGNYFDKLADSSIRDEVVNLGAKLAIESAALGYRGVLGVDFVITADNEVYAVEINARHNTSTHALWFLNRFVNDDPFAQTDSGAGAFFIFPARGNFSAMEWMSQLGADAFDLDSGFGILPLDTGGNELTALIHGADRERRQRLIEKARYVAEMSNPHYYRPIYRGAI